MVSSIRRINRLGVGAAVAVVLVVATALSSLAAPTGLKYYSVLITPATVAAGTVGQVFTVEIKNTSPSGSSSNFSSVSITVPSQFTVTAASLNPSSNPNLSAVVTTDSGNPSCNGGTSNTVNVCSLDPVKRTQSVKVKITATVTSTGLNCGNNTSGAWSVRPYTGSQLNGDPFARNPADTNPTTTTITATCSLAFTVQPSDAGKQTPIDPPVEVTVSDHAQGVSVTVSKASFTGSGTGSLSGTLTQTTNASGVATFDDLQISLAGDYKLQAAASGYGTATSNQFKVFEGTITCGTRFSNEGTDVTLTPVSGGCSFPITVTKNSVSFPTPQAASSKFELTIAWGLPIENSDPYVGATTFTVNGTDFTPNGCALDQTTGQAQYPQNPKDGVFWPASPAEEPWCLKHSTTEAHDFGGTIGWAYQVTEVFPGAGDPSITRCSTCR